jgi:hypothetical protein
MTRTRPAALLLVLALAGCAVPDPTVTTPTPPPHAEPATTISGASPTTVPPDAGNPAPACPLVLVDCPRPEVTPGAVIPSETGLCTTAYNPRRELTAAAKQRVLHAYGLPADAKVAEWDHLYPRWAGGTSTSSNVWPQVNPAEKKRKDALEQRLYLAVCKHDVRQVSPAIVKEACGRQAVDLQCARKMSKEYWRWW